LPVGATDLICEVGCGTARNLVLLGRKHPGITLYGIDASAEMLKTAEASAATAGLSGRIRLATALADGFTPATFGLSRAFDRLIYSYSLSIMDDWKEALEHGVHQISPGGTIHVVDFGNQEGLPSWFKKLLGGWLSQFHVRFRPEVRAWFEEQERAGKGRMTYRSVMRGYAYRLDFELKA
jgi:S-adenosylmethionine-diacylgycerolhomoserine-N-methlytransferase